MKGMGVGKNENLESILWVGMQNAEIQGADIKQRVKEFSLSTVYLLNSSSNQVFCSTTSASR